MNASLATLLVVEDDAQIRRFVRQSLEREGFRVREAEAYATGLIDAGTIKPDVVILDLGLPDGDGKNFVRELRGWSQVPVLILSARSMETDKIEVLDAGADDYLTKPFSVGELLARVRALLRRGSRSPWYWARRSASCPRISPSARCWGTPVPTRSGRRWGWPRC